MDAPKPKLRWFQYRLRTLLVVVTLFAIPCSWLAVKRQQAKRRLESLPSSIIVLHAEYWLDGGTITIAGISDDGMPHTVALGQQMFPDEKNAGCLYFDKEIVPIRSELERRVINLLKSARISYTPGPMHNPRISDAEQEDDTRRLCAKLVALVESDEYTTFHRSSH
jgi:hypothetical protein